MARNRPWTDAEIGRLKAPVKGRDEYGDHGPGHISGLRLRITENDKRSWAIVYRPIGKTNATRRTIGEFPVLNLEQARVEAIAWLHRAKAGEDPTAAAKADAARRALNSVRAAAEQFHTDYLSQLRSGDVVWSKLDKVLVAPLGARPIDKITRAELAAIINLDKEKSGPISANRLVSHLKKFFRWTAEQGLIDSSPAEFLAKPKKKEVARDRVLSDAEIKALWKATATTNIFHSAVRLLLITVTRRNEVCQGRRSEIDGDLWRIPPERSKNEQAHTLPLTPLAQRVLAETPEAPNNFANDKFIFSTTGSTGISGWGKNKKRIDKAMLAALREDNPKATLKPWRIHDLRRTGATVMANEGALPHVVEMVLNHVSGFRAGVAGVYNKAPYLAEMREALKKLSDHIERVIA